MRVLVYGLGRSGVAVSQRLSRQEHAFVVYDQSPKPEDIAAVKAVGGEVTWAPVQETVDLCIAAPGVPYDHPDLVALRGRGVETVGEVEWVYRTVDAPIIGVTGTAGKTTVTRWLTDVLQGAGVRAVAGGNIDPALSAVAEEGSTLVTELSSFQLERCPTLKPRVAVALNLGVDHLNRHGSVAAYHEAKWAITAQQDEGDIFIYNADDPELAAWADKTKTHTRAYSLRKPADAYLGETDGDLSLRFSDGFIMPVEDLSISGRHQWGNALAVALAAKAWGLSTDQIARGLAAFKGVPGRYSVVRTLGNIRFVEDSIATRGLAVRAALSASPAPIVWLVGGADKGARLADLAELIQTKVSLVVGIGEAGPAFIAQAGIYTKTTLCSQPEGEAALRCACEQALRHLRTEHGGRGTVLFAPLAASFDQFKDYRERADVFRHVVNALPAEPREALWTSY